MHRRARLSRPVSHKYALALAAKGFDQCEFIATGEFSRRKLMSEFGALEEEE